MASQPNSVHSSRASSLVDIDNEMLKNAKMERTPIIPTSWKVAMVFSGAITVVLVALLVVASKGHIPFIQQHHAVFEAVTITMGTSQILTTVGLALLYCQKKKQRDLREERALIEQGSSSTESTDSEEEPLLRKEKVPRSGSVSPPDADPDSVSDGSLTPQTTASNHVSHSSNDGSLASQTASNHDVSQRKKAHSF